MKEVRFFYVPNAGDTGELPEEEAAHAVKVLRLKAGNSIMLMDGKGCFYQAEVTLVTSHKCLYSILQTLQQERQWNGTIHLAIAPTKMIDRMEWMAEKATEIGVDTISFLNCMFSERRIVKTPRIDKIVVSAVKQSRKAWKPEVNDMESFKNFISAERKGAKYIAHCYNEIERAYLNDELKHLPKDEDITVLVGPEGDFSIDEVEMALANGYKSVHLGESRLRTETAGLVATMMIQLSKSKD